MYACMSGVDLRDTGRARSSEQGHQGHTLWLWWVTYLTHKCCRGLVQGQSPQRTINERSTTRTRRRSGQKVMKRRNLSSSARSIESVYH